MYWRMGSRTERFRRPHRLDHRRWFLLARAGLSLSFISAALAIMPFRLVIRMGLLPLGQAQRVAADDIVHAIELAASRLPWRIRCIEKALAAQRMLRSAGIDAILHYGARHHPVTGALEAHVWVTVNEHFVIGGREASGFAVLASYPAQPL